MGPVGSVRRVVWQDKRGREGVDVELYWGRSQMLQFP